jgi:hypothetical protein
MAVRFEISGVTAAVVIRLKNKPPLEAAANG